MRPGEKSGRGAPKSVSGPVMENPDGLRAQLISAPWARRASKRMLLSIIGGRVCAQASPSIRPVRLGAASHPARNRGWTVPTEQL